VGGGESLGELFSARRMEVRMPIRNDWLDLMAVFPESPDQPLDIPVRLTGSFGGKERHWDATITRRESGVSSNQMSWLIAEVDPESGSSRSRGRKCSIRSSPLSRRLSRFGIPPG